MVLETIKSKSESESEKLKLKAKHLVIKKSKTIFSVTSGSFDHLFYTVNVHLNFGIC